MSELAQFRLEMKKHLTRTLLGFENIHLSDLQTVQLLEHKEVHNPDFSMDEAIVIRNVIDTLDYLETLDLSRTPVDLKLYLELNRLLSAEQALFPGQLRTGNGFIPCIDEPIPPADPDFIKSKLHCLDTLSKDGYQEKVAESFCSLSKAQPFYDGNKRSTLFICNIALFKKELGIFVIDAEQEEQFNTLLTSYYRKDDPAVVEYLAQNCFKTGPFILSASSTLHR